MTTNFPPLIYSKDTSSLNLFDSGIKHSVRPELQGDVSLPPHIYLQRSDVSESLFSNPIDDVRYQGKNDHYEHAVLSWGKKIVQRGLQGNVVKEKTTDWLKLGLSMIDKTLYMLNNNDSEKNKVLEDYFGDSSSSTQMTLKKYAQKAKVVLENHLRQQGKQIVIFKEGQAGAFVFTSDPHQRIFINQKGFNASGEDSFMGCLMIHEATHFEGAEDNGYISQVGIKGPTDKINNADSLAEAMQFIASAYDEKYSRNKKSNEWFENRTYQRGDVVFYKGQYYSSAGDNISGWPPVNGKDSFHWKKILGVDSKQQENQVDDWHYSTIYVKGDKVVYNGILYSAQVSRVSGEVPGRRSDSFYWKAID